MSKKIAWVKFDQIDKQTGQFVVSPLKRGMGITIGNALRRVLLSSLSGLAITSIKIKGVEHEFATIPDVVEDVLDIICNLKGVVFKSVDDTDAPRTMTIKKKGKGNVTAKDIEGDSTIKIVNSSHHIAKLSDKGELELSFVVNRGVGYQAIESRSEEDKDVSAINVDSSFSPIVRVNHNVESVRVGKELDYESLTVDVMTDGSITAENAVRQASEILIDFFGLFGEMNKQPEDVKAVTSDAPSAASDTKQESALNLTIDDLELSARSSNCLKRAGIESVSDLVQKGLDELYQIKNFGKKSADEINEKLAQYNLSLKESSELVGTV